MIGRVFIGDLDGGNWREVGHTQGQLVPPAWPLLLHVTGTLRQCPYCRTALLILNGRPQGRVVINVEDGKTTITAHAEGCDG